MSGTQHDGHAGRRRRIERDIRQEPFVNERETPPVAIDAALARHRVPGCAVAVIADGELAWAQGYGVTGDAGSPPVAADTIFQACSISKAVAAIAALHLVQDGALDLDEDVNAYLRSWHVPRNGDWQPRVTLRQLLSHTAALTGCWYPGYDRRGPFPTLLQTLRGEPPANTPPVRVVGVPGTQHRYSGSHFSVVQQLLVDVTGQPFPILLRDLVFDPLGMDHSGYEIDFPARHGGATALAHDSGGMRIAGDWRVLPESAGAGLWTTPADLCRLAVDLLRAWSGQSAVVLDEKTAQQLLTPQVGGWGLGWAVNGDGPLLRCGHGGSNIGYKCRLVAWPHARVGSVIMTNADDGDYLVGEINAAIAREYGWPDLRADELVPADAAIPEARSAYAGRYGDEAGLALMVGQEGGILQLQVPGQPPLALRPVGPDRFRATEVATEVSFAVEAGTAGQVASLTLRQLGGEVTLERLS